MLDISNKLHAMVDEFVSNLTSQCQSLVHNVPAEGHKNVAHDSRAEETAIARPSNRTTQEVLKELRRPSESVTPSLEGVDHNPDSRSVPILSNKTVSKAKVKQGRPTKGTAAKGKFSHTVEILSSDHSSDDCPIAIIKSKDKKVGKQRVKKLEPSTSQGVSTGVGIRSPSTSPESSHVMNYSFEEDTQSLDTKNPPVETTFTKLRWPEDVGDEPEEEETWKSSEHNKAEPYSESHGKHEKKKCSEETSLDEGDESNDEDVEPHPNGRGSDTEELPVLPRVLVKRKVMGEPGGPERRTQRGGTKISSPQLKKQRTPQIDASVITQLEFSRRPVNSVSN